MSEGQEPRTYLGKVSTETLLEWVEHPRRSAWKNMLRRLWCRLRGGHRIVRQWWCLKEGAGQGMWHVGCTRCPEFHVENPRTVSR